MKKGREFYLPPFFIHQKPLHRNNATQKQAKALLDEYLQDQYKSKRTPKTQCLKSLGHIKTRSSELIYHFLHKVKKYYRPHPED